MKQERCPFCSDETILFPTLMDNGTFKSLCITCKQEYELTDPKLELKRRKAIYAKKGITK